jgi:hypothetical protein
MHDPETFETRLADAFERLADRAPVDVDPVATARAARHAPGRPKTLRIWDPQPTWARAAVVLLALGLLLAMLGATALIGSRLRDPLAVDEPRMVEPSIRIAPSPLAEAPLSPEPSALAEAAPIVGRIVGLSTIEAALGSFTWETFAGPLPQPNPSPIRGNHRVGYVYAGDLGGVFYSEDGLHWQNVTEDTPDAVPPDMLGDCEIEATYGQWIACARFRGPEGPQQLVILKRGPSGWAFEPIYLDRAHVDDDGYVVDDILPVQSGQFSLITSGASDGNALIREAGGSFESINLDYPLTSLLAVPDGGFVAFPEGVMGDRTVTSDDGRTWVDRGPPGYLADLPASARLARQPGRLVALTQAFDETRCDLPGCPQRPYTVWASTDGVTWTRQTPPVQYPLPIVEPSPPQEAIYGFHRYTVEITDLGLLWDGQYLSIDDGRSWAQVPEAPDPYDYVDCGVGGGVDIGGWTADTWYRHGGNGCGRDMSVGRFGAD